MNCTERGFSTLVSQSRRAAQSPENLFGSTFGLQSPFHGPRHKKLAVLLENWEIIF